MKTKSFKAVTVFMLAFAYVAIVFISGCKKEGPIGPAGADGTNGVDANAVSAADQASYNAASGYIGGRLYDHFLEQLAITDTSLTNHADFFRCKQCHGWDLRGSNGAYINRAPNANRPAVAANDLFVYAQTHNVKQIFDAVKHTGGRNRMSSANAKSYTGAMPDYGLILTNSEIWDITKFLKETALNTFNLYDMNTSGYYPTGTKSFSNIGKDGNATNGNAVFASSCASCHGADGTTIALDGGAAYVGDFMRNNPPEFQHKTRCGQPATGMGPYTTITESVVKDLLKAGQDTLLYPGF